LASVTTAGQPGIGLSVRDLIEISQESGVFEPSIDLRSAVVNHDVVFSGSTDQTHSLQEITQDLQQELITYVVLQRPVQNITNGQNADYSMMMSVSGNAVFWPDARDSIANGLGRKLLSSQAGGNNSPIPRVFAGHNVNYVVDTRHKRKSTFAEKLKAALSWAWDHRADIGAVAATAFQAVAPLLAAGSNSVDEVVVKVSYLRTIRLTLESTGYFQQDPTFEPMISALVAELIRRRAILNSPLCPNRVVHTSVFAEQEDRPGHDPSLPVTPSATVQSISNYSDHNTNRAALARYGIERNPGPD